MRLPVRALAIFAAICSLFAWAAHEQGILVIPLDAAACACDPRQRLRVIIGVRKAGGDLSLGTPLLRSLYG